MENDEQYVKQLEEIFNGFCPSSQPGIDKFQLISLCERLSLDADSIGRLFALAFEQKEFEEIASDDFIAFDQFCQCFVAVLSEITESTESGATCDSPCDENEDSVKPRLVRGGKKYGRKSAPSADLSDIEHPVDCNENPNVTTDDHWLGEMLTSSDENEDALGVGNKVYYEPGFGIDEPDKGHYFESSHSGTTSASTDLKKQPNEISAMSTEDMGQIADATPNSTFIHEGCIPNLFLKLDLDGSGMIEVESLVAMWKKAGVEDAIQILEALDITHRNGLIDAFELSTALEKEAVSGTSLLPTTNSKLHSSITYALVASYREFVYFVNSEAEQYKNLTEKMKDDLERSELRTSKLIDEVDDRYLSMDQQNEKKLTVVERKWAKKLNCAQHAHERERDTMLIQFNQDKELFRKEIDALQYSDECLRNKIHLLQSENDSLSRESLQLCEKLNEAEKDADRLRKDLECLLNEKTNDTSNPINTSQEEKFATIIKEYEAQCRHLADKNDELVIEVESLHGKIKHYESKDHNRGVSVSSFHDEKLREGSSPKRKKPLRRESNLSEYLDYNTNNYSDMENDTAIEHLERPRRNNVDAQEYANIRMAELERLVEDLRADKRKYMDEISFEKAEMEKEFQIRLENEKAKLSSLDDNRAVEEQQNMTMRLLKQITQEKDELESKFLKLKQKTENESSESQHGMADLCREFAQEKAEVVAKHEEQMQAMRSKLEVVERRLAEEEKASGRFAEQLKAERVQHTEALAAHQEVISKFERSSTPVAPDGSVGADKIKEITDNFEAEVTRLKQEHTTELKKVKRDLEEKLEEVMAEKHKVQETASMCSELDRLQESIGVERRDMHDRMQKMRDAFEHEAAELKQMLDCDKAKLRQQLNDEVASLRQRLAEETEREMKKKKQSMEEAEQKMRVRVETVESENCELVSIRSEMEDLKQRNQDLENLLSRATTDLHSRDMKMGEAGDDVRQSSLLKERLDDVNRKVSEKEQLNLNLRTQMEDLLDSNQEKSHVISRMQNEADVMEVEKTRLKRQYDELLEKVRGLEHEKLTCRLENAGLNAKCEKLERSGMSSPTPSPRVRSRRKSRLDEEQSRGRRLAEEKIGEMTKEIADLKAQLTQLAANGLANQSISDDVMHHVATDDESDALSVTSQGSGATSDPNMLRSRLTMTRQQLNSQMKRTKDLYSKLAKSETLVKDLYCENSHLMRALQVTESRQKEAERRCEDEKDRCQALGRLLQQVCPEVP
uniref:Ninein-like protein n=1 Tax=Phallusia mammillata TaxID=59560 RepID=A0A6F9DMV8_9ASCI|nr:ninein-like protein [Phallusia mammillata]